MSRSTQLSSNDMDILAVLARAGRPLSAYDILAAVKSGGVKAPTQVYRSLDKLARGGRVHRIEALNAFIACSEDKHARKPGFVICRDCGSVREFEDPRVHELAQSAAANGFHVDQVSLEIYGHCDGCCGKHGEHAHADWDGSA